MCATVLVDPHAEEQLGGVFAQSSARTIAAVARSSSGVGGSAAIAPALATTAGFGADPRLDRVHSVSGTARRCGGVMQSVIELLDAWCIAMLCCGSVTCVFVDEYVCLLHKIPSMIHFAIHSQNIVSLTS